MPLLKLANILATTTNTTVDASAWQPVLDALSSQISVTTVIGVIAAVIGGGIGLVFMWWGTRKAVRGIMSAATRGKLKF